MGLPGFKWRTAFDNDWHCDLRAAIRAEADGPGERTRADLVPAEGYKGELGSFGRVHGLDLMGVRRGKGGVPLPLLGSDPRWASPWQSPDKRGKKLPSLHSRAGDDLVVFGSSPPHSSGKSNGSAIMD